MPILCYHCNELVPNGINLYVTINKQQQAMCCIGCQAIAQTIVDNNLTDYYKFRSEPAKKGNDSSIGLIPNQLKQHILLDDEELQSEFSYDVDNHKETILTIDGISCAACAWLIEKQIVQLSGVIKIEVNASSQRATLQWHHKTIKLSEIISAIEKIGYQALPFKANTAEQLNKKKSKAFIRRLGISGILMMQIMMIAFGLYFGAFSGMESHNLLYLRGISLILTIPIVIYGAWPFYQGAVIALRARRLSMDVPVAIAISLAFGASAWATISQQGEVYFESVAMFTFLLLVGKFLEFRARSRAAELSANLLKLMPMTATKLVAGQEQLIPAKKLQLNDLVLVKPGEVIPADGEITQGSSQLNEAMLTGEQLPISKTLGELVFAGTINGDSNLIIKITKTAGNTFLNQLIRLSEASQNYKPKLAQLSDTIAQYFIAIILVTATISSIYWLQKDPSHAFWITVSILVATCPCALSLATPTALTCATTRLNRAGIMIKSSHVLETLPNINCFAFDKTGTLTTGAFEIAKVTQLIELSTHTQSYLLAVSAALESHSEHPLAKAFFPHKSVDVIATNIKVHSGLGVSGDILNDHYQIGKVSWLVTNPVLAEKLKEAQCVLCKNQQVLAAFYLQDSTRPESLSVLNQLKQHAKLILLSGDNQAGCEKVAQQLPLDNIYSGLTAQDKMHHIQAQKNSIVAMVGDGVNDTPVFSAAHVSFAMGSGTDIAKNGADVIMLNNSLTAVTECLNVAKKTKRIIWQNYGWALVYNAIVLPLAVMGLITPYLAVLGMSASSILVVTNSLRLLKK